MIIFHVNQIVLSNLLLLKKGFELPFILIFNEKLSMIYIEKENEVQFVLNFGFYN